MNHIISIFLLAIALCLISSCSDHDQSQTKQDRQDPSASRPSKPTSPLYSFELNDIDGKPVKLADYEGRVLLLVNVASKCGFTKQYPDLQALYEKYKDQGFTLLAFPANNFGQQEPGSNNEIKEFCTSNYGVTFPLFAKISVKGDDIHPLYQYLTAPGTNPTCPGPIQGNFNKFLIDRAGNILTRFESKVQPLDPELTAPIETALKEKS